MKTEKELQQKDKEGFQRPTFAFLVDGKKEHRFQKSRIVIGSVISADIRLSSEGVSPIHAVVEIQLHEETNQWVAILYDLASKEGIFYQDQKTIRVNLQEQDQFRIGTHLIRFWSETPDQEAGRDQLFRIAQGRKLFLDPQEDLSPLVLENESQAEVIFSPDDVEERLSLEVVISWHDTILSVDHFNLLDSQGKVAGQRSRFGIPPLLSSGSHPILSHQGGEFELHFDEEMKGVVFSE